MDQNLQMKLGVFKIKASYFINACFILSISLSELELTSVFFREVGLVGGGIHRDHWER